MSDTTDQVSGLLKAAIAAVVVIVLAGLAVLGLWQAGWWFSTQNTNRTDRVIQQGYANQTALRARVGQEFSDIATLQRDERVTPANIPADKPSIIQDGDRICAQIPQFAPGYPADPQWLTWEHANCSDGTLSAASSLVH